MPLKHMLKFQAVGLPIIRNWQDNADKRIESDLDFKEVVIDQV